MKYSLGIDLGTTFSSVATIDENGRPIILMNSQGKPITPSVIYFGDGKPLVGEEAKEMQAFGDPNIASFFKRNMGDHNFILNMNGHDYTPVDLSAIILSKLKADAETRLGCSVNQAVITVPAYFNNLQREATIKSGEIAGLKVLRIINEPTAATLAYGMKDSSSKQTVLVYDLGGGTFDVTIAKITDSTIEVIATDGDHELGGKDWDDLIATYLGQRFYDDHGIDPLEDLITFNDLLIRCEDAKKQLSTRDKARVIISHQGEKETYTLDRSTFEDITKNLMERTQNLTEQVLKDAGLKWKKLTGVLLIGGSTRMPMVWNYVKNMSGKDSIRGVNVDEAVALGAAIQANIDAAEKEEKNQTFNQTFTLVGKKRTLDVMSHSLGTVSENEDRSQYINVIIIPKNIQIPCTESRPFQLRTFRNNDNKLELYMLQGENDDPVKCIVLGKYTFSEITYVQGNIAILDIEYVYDRNGVVKVAVKERSTGKKLPMQIEPVPDDMSWLSRPPEDNKFVMAHLSVLIAIDISGSMRGRPLSEAQKAAKRFVQEIDLGHASIGLMGFADEVKITQELCHNAKRLNNGIDELSHYVGLGNKAEPFSDSLNILRTSEDPRFVIVLTDGRWCNQEKAIECAKQCHEEGIDIIAIGFGSANESFLKAVATSDENALFTDLSSLISSFSKIAQVLTESSGGTKSGFLSIFK